MINGPSEWKDFAKSTIWTDIQEELMIWLEEIRSQLESDEVDLGEVKALRGSAKAIRHVLQLPENLEQMAIDQFEEEEKHE